jgi:hypothetical protein
VNSTPETASLAEQRIRSNKKDKTQIDENAASHQTNYRCKGGNIGVSIGFVTVRRGTALLRRTCIALLITTDGWSVVGIPTSESVPAATSSFAHKLAI